MNPGFRTWTHEWDWENAIQRHMTHTIRVSRRSTHRHDTDDRYNTMCMHMLITVHHDTTSSSNNTASDQLTRTPRLYMPTTGALVCEMRVTNECDSGTSAYTVAINQPAASSISSGHSLRNGHSFRALVWELKRSAAYLIKYFRSRRLCFDSIILNGSDGFTNLEICRHLCKYCVSSDNGPAQRRELKVNSIF